MASLVGRTVGRYRILAELGRGGMGVVYRALDTMLDREVALKVLPPEIVADDDRRRRFLREAQTASRLEHAHIGVIHEVGEADGVSFIAMELVRGEPLSQAIARGSLGTSRSLELATEVAEGLARAHEQGIVHRDLKPANVMLTDDGHAKIIDFGLAKSLDSGEPSSDAATVAASTDIGVIKGTAAYMSPEQARGERLDARSDLFSFGVMLYQMLSGRVPFQAPSYVDTLHKISHDDAPPLSWTGTMPAPDAQQDIERLLEKCLAKDPAARYQTARDLVVDLRAVRRRLDTGTSRVLAAMPAPVEQEPGRPSWILVAGGVALALALIATGFGIYRTMRPAASSPPPLAPSGKPSLAVLYFQNNTGSPQLDWLRTGLTDMVVNDLAQSPDFEVLSTDRLYQILSALKRQNDAVISFDTVQELARRAGVKHVLVGNYVKAGDAIRINITLQEAESGKIVSADRVEAANESSLFSTVDDLTRRVKANFSLTDRVARSGPPRLEPAGAPAGPSSTAGYFRELSEVTTSSLDAYRSYVQGIDLHQRGQERDAEPLLKKAIEIDPKFALAMTKLAVIENNLGHGHEREEYGRRAVELVDRLSPRERYYIEGYYYGLRTETMAKAIESYQRAVALYSDHVSAKHNLAVLYGNLERYDESIPLYEELRRRGAAFAFTYTNLMRAYTNMGQFDQARQVMDDYLREGSPAPAVLRRYGIILTAWQKYDEARAAVARADSLDAGDAVSDYVRWAADVLEGKWADADAIARRESQLADPNWKWLGWAGVDTVELYAGKSAAASRSMEASSTSAGPSGSNQTSYSRAIAAAQLLALGRPAEALVQAERGLKEAKGGEAEWGCLYFLALAQSRAGRTAEAAKTIDTLRVKANAWPSSNQTRAVHQLQGVLALDRRDSAGAVAELLQAEAMLKPRGLWDAAVPQPWIWFDLGSALLAAGRDDEAATRFQLIVDRSERVYFPIEYVRSLYFLAQIAERRGDRDKAREYYQRFVDLWGNGEVDRDHVAEARKKIEK